MQNTVTITNNTDRKQLNVVIKLQNVNGNTLNPDTAYAENLKNAIQCRLANER